MTKISHGMYIFICIYYSKISNIKHYTSIFYSKWFVCNSNINNTGWIIFYTRILVATKQFIYSQENIEKLGKTCSYKQDLLYNIIFFF